MANLLNETMSVLERYEKTAYDVLWVGSKNGKYSISFDAFSDIAAKTDYDSGYGSQKIAFDLVVVGNGWWLERYEYDGSEYWEYKEVPVLKGGQPFSRVTREGSMWDDLDAMQIPDEEDV